MAPGPANSPLIDVACPACGEIYHLRPDTVGKNFDCVNKLCRRRFKIEPAGREAEASDAIGPRSPAATPDEDETPVERIAATALEQEPTPDDDVPPIQIPPAKGAVSDSSGPAPTSARESPDSAIGPVSPGAAPSASKSPVASGTSQPPAAESSPAAPRRPRARRRGPPRWALQLAAAAAVALIALASYVGVIQFREWSRSPEEEWNKAQALYQDHKWGQARAAFAKYAERFPKASQAAMTPFFLDMCDAGEEVFSPTGDLGRALAALERLFRSHRDSQAYRDYAGDLFQALGRLVERSVERAKQLSELADLDRAKKAMLDVDHARRAHELLRTVSEAVKAPWAPERAAKLAQSIDETARIVKLNLTRTEIVAHFNRVPGFPLQDDLASVYSRIEELLHDEPELAGDPQVLKAQTLAHRSEAARVRYVRADDDDQSTAEMGESAPTQMAMVVWQSAEDDRADSPVKDDADAVVAALAQGVLYAFDAAGRPRWARRLGLDVDRLPVRMPASDTAGEALIVRSSAERAVLALDATTGVERWRFAAPAAMTAPPTLVSIANPGGKPILRGLLPTADGRIHVFEPVLGKRLGYYDVGWPLTTGGAYDALTRRVYFAAESDRVLAIDPAAIDNGRIAACSSVLFPRHASGSLRSEPRVVGPYLMMIEGADLDRTRLRAFALSESGFADPDAAPLAEQTASGWSWFAPQASPDRLMFATDQGELGLFGVNLDNPAEAVYRLIEDVRQPPSTILPGASGTRTLLAYVEDESLWVQAGSALHRLSLDILRQQIGTTWANETSAGRLAEIPLHEAQARRVDRRLILYLGAMSGDGRRCELAAREAQTGSALWRRQVGLHPLDDPFVEGDRILLADRGGRIAAFDLNGQSMSKTTLIEPEDRVTLTEMVGEPLLIDAFDGRPRLMAKIAGSAEVAIRPLEPQSDWQFFQPPANVVGRPCLLDGALVAACSDGLLHRLAPGPAAPEANDQPFVLALGARPAGAAISITPLERETVLVSDGQTLRRLQYRLRDSVGQWIETGQSYAAETRLARRPLIHGERIFVAGATGQVEALDAREPARLLQRCSLAGKPTSDLFVRSGRVLAVVDERVLVSLTSADGAMADEPEWKSARRPGAICGQPLAHGDTLVVADASGAICGLNLADGKQVWQTQLAAGQAPAAAPAVVADRFMLVPLVDGALAIVPLPGASAEVAEANP